MPDDREELAALIYECGIAGDYPRLGDLLDRILARWRLVPVEPPLWGECPRCGAPVGAVCRGENGGLVAPHKERPRIE